MDLRMFPLRWHDRPTREQHKYGCGEGDSPAAVVVAVVAATARCGSGCAAAATTATALVVVLPPLRPTTGPMVPATVMTLPPPPVALAARLATALGAAYHFHSAGRDLTVALGAAAHPNRGTRPGTVHDTDDNQPALRQEQRSQGRDPARHSTAQHCPPIPYPCHPDLISFPPGSYPVPRSKSARHHTIESDRFRFEGVFSAKNRPHYIENGE